MPSLLATLVALFSFVHPVYSQSYIPQTNWSLVYVDSQELSGEYAPAKYAIDGDPSTFWHTQWYDASPPYPHEIVINLNGFYRINGFSYLPRQDGCPNGTVADYSFYVSADDVNWTLVASGTFGSGSGPKQVLFSGVDGSYVKLVGLSEINGNPWMSAAEINVMGTLAEPPPKGAIVSPSGDVTITAGQTVSFSGTGTDPQGSALTYKWTFGDPSIPASSSQNPGAVQFDNAGTYTVTLTVTDALGLVDPSPPSLTVTVLPATDTPPKGTIVSPSGNVTIVAGQTVSFSGTGTAPQGSALTYKWTFGDPSIPASSSQNPGAVQFDTPGTFAVTLTVTDALGLVDPNPPSVTVTVLSAPPAILPQAGWSLLYVDSQQLIGANCAAVNAFDGNPATFWHTQYYPTSPPLPHEIQINLGASYVITGFGYLPRQDGSRNGTIADYRFYVSADGKNWADPVATGTFANSTAEKDVSFAPVTGQYIRLVALSEVNGNPWTSAAEIYVMGTLATPTPKGEIVSPSGNVTIIAGQTVSFSGTGTDPQGSALTYKWTFGDPSIPASSNQNPDAVQFENVGTYTVTLTVTDALGLVDPTPPTVTVTVLPATDMPPKGAIVSPSGNVTITAGQSVSFSGTATDPQGSALTYKWTFGDPSIPASSSQNPGAVEFNNTGTFTVTLTVTDSLGLVDPNPPRVTVTVNGNPPQGVITSPSGNVIITAGKTVTFSGTGTDPQGSALTYDWAFGDPSIPSSSNQNPGPVQFNNTGTFTVTLTVTDALGLVDPNPPTVTITVLPATYMPPEGAIVSPTGNATIIAGQTISFSGAGTDPQGSALTYKWTFGDSSIPASSSQNPGAVQFNNTGTFTVTLTVTDSLGLVDPNPPSVTVTVQAPSSTTISESGWSLLYVDSQQLIGANCAAVNAFDGNPATFWHTQYYPTSTPLPHEIQIDLGASYVITGFGYLPRQDGSRNGTIAGYRFYVSADGKNWGNPVATGTFANSKAEKDVSFAAATGQYIRLVALSEVNGNPWTSAAEIKVMGVPNCTSGVPVVEISQPRSDTVYWTPTLGVEAYACLNPGYGVRFDLDGGNGSGGSSQSVYSSPYQYTFTGVGGSYYHRVDADIIDSTGNLVAGTYTKDQVNNVAVGDYYVGVGDSITAGHHDDITCDNTSTDGRNTGGGYEPILNNLMTAAKGYPQNVVDAGVAGDASIDGVQKIAADLNNNPGSVYVLVQYGTNDALYTPPIPSGLGLSPTDPGYPGTFKDNMQQIINAIKSAGKIPYLAKAPCAFGQYVSINATVQKYNQVIDELVIANNIQVQPPDFYCFFSANPTYMSSDGLHPNGLGYQGMAAIWSETLLGTYSGCLPSSIPQCQ